MERTKVRSSNLASIGYDVDSHILEVEFKTRTVYQYFNVPESVFVAFMNAQSHGRFLNEYIVDNYRYQQIR